MHLLSIRNLCQFFWSLALPYLTLTFLFIRFSYSSSVITPFSTSNSTRLESISSKRSISSVVSLSTLAFFGKLQSLFVYHLEDLFPFFLHVRQFELLHYDGVASAEDKKFCSGFYPEFFSYGLRYDYLSFFADCGDFRFFCHYFTSRNILLSYYIRFLPFEATMKQLMVKYSGLSSRKAGSESRPEHQIYYFHVSLCCLSPVPSFALSWRVAGFSFVS